jgi:hypothetical protein
MKDITGWEVAFYISLVVIGVLIAVVMFGVLGLR